MPRLLIALLCAGLLIAAPAAHAVGAGDPAPSFVLAGAGGETIDSTALRGKVVYVDFWASWCGPCRRSFPWMNSLHERYAKQGLAIVGINVDRRRLDADKFLRDVPASFAIAFDAQGSTPAAFDVHGMPSSYLVDRQGIVVAVEQGFNDQRKGGIEQLIRAELARP